MNKLILGSQSPQRLRLMESVVGGGLVDVLPPKSDDEPGFEGLTTASEIEERLRLVVDRKCQDVCAQLASQGKISDDVTVVCADTVVVCQDSHGERQVLGKPPLPDWQATVRQWFRVFYSNQTHDVWTGFRVSTSQESEFQIVKAQVQFPQISDDWIEWYIATEEPVGKAGGYGIQGHAAAFVRSIKGSLTTIIGLPQWELRATLQRIGGLP